MHCDDTRQGKTEKQTKDMDPVLLEHTALVRDMVKIMRNYSPVSYEQLERCDLQGILEAQKLQALHSGKVNLYLKTDNAK